MNWFCDNEATQIEIKGSFHSREWGVKTPEGDILRRGSNSDKRLSRLDIFLLMFPPSELNLLLFCTNTNLDLKNYKMTTKGEIIKFFGVSLLITKFEFRSRATLWSTTEASKYEIAPSFGRTAMPHKRFDQLWECIQWANQPKVKPQGMSSERYIWHIVDGFVNEFNNHWVKNFIPSEYICVD
jgi:Transposase IS4